MATPAPVYRSQGNSPFRSERQNSQLKRGQTVPYDVNGAPSGGVPEGRLIDTTAPLTGGGPLTSDLTLGISAATGAARGTMSAADKTKLDAISGTNTGDQTITLTGDVTGSGAGSFAATIANGAVTLAKQANMATASVVYRKTAGSGAPEVNTLATLKTDLGLAGTNSGDQFTNMTSSRILGRKTAGFGAAEELTGTQATTLLDAFTSALQGVAPASGGGTTNFLRADGSWAAPTGTSGSLIYKAGTVVAGAAVTNITVSGLDLDADGCYKVIIRLKNASAVAANVSLFYNSDTTATNYFVSQTSGGASTQSNNAILTAHFATNVSEIMITLEISRMVTRVMAIGVGGVASNSATNLRSQGYTHQWTTSGTNVTGITINTNTANAIDIGSRVDVWRVRNS